MIPGAGKLSVIVPTLNEEGRIAAQLGRLTRLVGVDEVLVVDGGSTDGTARAVAGFEAVRWLQSSRGRGIQLNAGAAAAIGDVLLFLHADVELPPDAVEWIEKALSNPGVIAGAFRTWTRAESARRWPGPLLHLADLRSRYSNLPYGDQALFVRRPAFERVGGFPEQPLMEDLELSRRLSRVGHIRIVPANVSVSGRRFESRPLYYFTLMNVFPLLYRIGVSPQRLAALYRDPR